jgi:uncharacterized RDD family membrane protein YckC
MSTDLTFYGTIHVNRLGIVESEVAELLDDADAVCIETQDIKETGLREILWSPLVFLGLFIHLYMFLSPMMILASRHVHPTERVAISNVVEETETEVHKIDREIGLLLGDRGPLWPLANWTILAAVAYVVPIAVGLLAAAGVVSFGAIRLLARRTRNRFVLVPALLLASALFWAPVWLGYVTSVPISVGVFAFLAGAGLTLDERNEIMIDQTSDIAADHDYDEILLVTGKAHVSGMLSKFPVENLNVGGVFKQRWFRRGKPLDVDEQLAKHSDDGEDFFAPALETAGSVLARRAAALTIDWFVVGFLTLFASIYVDDWFPEFEYWWLLAVPIAFLYFVFLTGNRGQTLGKKILGLVVVSTDDAEITTRTLAIRFLAQFVDFLPLYFVGGAILTKVTDDGQRVGDLLANTTVVLTAERYEAIQSVQTTDDAGTDDDELEELFS